MLGLLTPFTQQRRLKTVQGSNKEEGQIKMILSPSCDPGGFDASLQGETATGHSYWQCRAWCEAQPTHIALRNASIHCLLCSSVWA